MRSRPWAGEPTACDWNPGRPRASPSVQCVNSTCPTGSRGLSVRAAAPASGTSSRKHEVTEHHWPAPLACSAGLPCSPPSLKNRLLPRLSEQPSLLWLLLGDRGPHRQAALVGLVPGAAQGSHVNASRAAGRVPGACLPRGFPRGSEGVSIS